MTNGDNILITVDSITDTANAILNNPVFIKYGLLELFLNGVLLPVLPFALWINSVPLNIVGESKILVVLVLSASWISGGVLWYYAGCSGN